MSNVRSHICRLDAISYLCQISAAKITSLIAKRDSSLLSLLSGSHMVSATEAAVTSKELNEKTSRASWVLFAERCVIL